MIDKLYKDLYNEYSNFGRWTEEIIKEGLEKAYTMGLLDGHLEALKEEYQREHEESNL